MYAFPAPHPSPLTTAAAALTECSSTQYEDSPATATSDRSWACEFRSSVVLMSVALILSYPVFPSLPLPPPHFRPLAPILNKKPVFLKM